MTRAAAQSTTRTTCPYCGVGCGVLATMADDGAVSVAGDPDHPANFGRLCSKGAALAETIGLEGRLLHPVIDGEPASWPAALDRVATGFSRTIARHGPDSVAFYVSGQLLTEDYYVANKLMKGFIGSANIDTNSRLCMASSVAGHRRAFGSDTVPGTYEDLELADLVVLVGSNLAWCHPVLFQRLMAARAARPEMRIVAIDPRRTVTADAADLHLALRPGSDVALFNGLLARLERDGRVDQAFVANHTTGFAEALAAARIGGTAGIARVTGLAPAAIEAFYRLASATAKLVTVFSQGVNQSTAGTDKVNAIINCHLATGRIGHPGMGPFSVTGQPNAMGGREVGGLANQLAAHLDLDSDDDRDLVRAFWQAPRMAAQPGLKAVELFEAVAKGRVKALWIMATNPVVSLPEADAVRAALALCPFVAVSEVERHTDTTAYAHVLLPAAAWGEKEGTVTNSERRISRQRSFLAVPGEARPDWWIISAVARRMGFTDAFDYPGPAAIHAEYAALTALGNQGRRDLDLGGLAALSDRAYDRLEPVQWPVTTAGRQGGRFFADGQFFTPDGRARLVALPVRGPAALPSRAFPLVLNTGRVRDHWHTLSRTGRSPRLSQHIAEPFLEIHGDDAAAAGLSPAALATVSSPTGAIVLRVVISAGQARGSVFAPMHWTDRHAACARVGRLIAGATDAISGQPELKATPVQVAPFAAAWYGFAVTAAAPDIDPAAGYWATARCRGGWRVELAGLQRPESWDRFARRLFGLADEAPADFVTYDDPAGGSTRIAWMADGRLRAALFIAGTPVAVARSWLAARLDDAPDAISPAAILAGRPAAGGPDPGALLCSCFGVGINTIRNAVIAGRCSSVQAVGEALSAGTGCGSCRPEIGRLIDDLNVRRAV